MNVASAKPIFALQGVGLRLGSKVQALADLNLHIHQGERVALIGANGSGKSSLLRLLHGVTLPSAGQLMRDADQRQALLFQRPFMLRLSVQRNVALALWLAGTPWRAAMAQADIALQERGLAALAQRNARQLSVGQLQRVALARALALKPQVLLLDEPTASLDPHAKREVEALMAQVAGQRSMTLVFASHNLGQVKRLASRVVYLEQGRIRADLPVEEFFSGTVLQDKFPEAHLFVKGELA